MTAELVDYISKLNIYVYVLSDGSTVLGKLIDVHPSSVELVGLCKMQTVMYDNSIQQLISPVIPASIEEKSIISLSHIMIQSPASLVLKKSYCDTLLKLKINQSISSSEGQSFDSSLNPFKDRWK